MVDRFLVYSLQPFFYEFRTQAGFSAFVCHMLKNIFPALALKDGYAIFLFEATGQSVRPISSFMISDVPP